MKLTITNIVILIFLVVIIFFSVLSNLKTNKLFDRQIEQEKEYTVLLQQNESKLHLVKENNKNLMAMNHQLIASLNENNTNFTELIKSMGKTNRANNQILQKGITELSSSISTLNLNKDFSETISTWDGGVNASIKIPFWFPLNLSGDVNYTNTTIKRKYK